MEASPSSTSQQPAVKRYLEQALTESNEPEVRFHLRQALQMLV